MKTQLTIVLLALAGVIIFFANPIFAADSTTNEIVDFLAKAESAVGKKDYNSAITYFDKLILLGDTDAYASRGFMYFQKKEYDKAISDYSKLIEIRPTSYIYEDRGDVYVKKGDPVKAVEDYTESIRRNPKNGRVYVSRALQYSKLNIFDAALIDCNMAILLLSDDLNAPRPFLEAAYGLRGSIFSSQGKYNRAYDDYSKVIEINPAKFEAFDLRGWAGFMLKEYDKSISDYQTALRLNPKDDLACRRLGWIMAACLDAKYRDGQKALENAKKACELTAWKEPQCLDALAAAYAEAGNFEEAVTWEQKAIKTGLTNKDLADSKARLELYKQKKPFRIQSK
jgi:tetratricopeptide (TPR) repeat protein